MVRELFLVRRCTPPAGLPAILDCFDEALLEAKMHLVI